MAYVFGNCPVCLTGAYIDMYDSSEKGDNVFIVNCLRCGIYRITHDATEIIKSLESEKINLFASSKINEFSNKKYIFDVSDIDKFKNTSIPSVDVRATNLLQCFAEYYPQLGTGPPMNRIEYFLGKLNNIDKTDHNDPVAKFVLQSLSRSYCPNKEELDYLITDYHIVETKFITLFDINLEISPKGWARLDEMKIKIQESNIGFIAMKFSPELVEYSEKWFEGGITLAGYEAKAMYSHQHTSIIDNEMIALIRRSKFLVCDLTKSSRGAYYEAGFAHGLDIPVIFLCEKEYFHKEENELSTDEEGVHFDTNHYPVIEWEYDKGEELRKELKDWIEATIGRGLLK